MEKNWERTLPFFYVDKKTIYSLFKGVIKDEQIVDINIINEGCRTSNYMISTTTNDKYILKIFLDSEQQYIKECKILDLLKNNIPVQEVCRFEKSAKIDNKFYAIYKYLEGKTISRSLKNGYMISEETIRDAAIILAEIHKFKFYNVGFFDENLCVRNCLKPLNEWYDEFTTEKVKNRIGIEAIQNIKLLIEDNIEDLLLMDKEPRLIHGDFQGTNILVDRNRICGIIDWEFAMAGHPLSDIGQFFRYEEYFNRDSIFIFEEEYRKKSDYILPENWYKLSKIRDLANLIQLIGFEQDMPNKYSDVKSLILRTIDDYQKY